MKIENSRVVMKNEIINKIMVNDQNELLLKLFGQGSPSYQYVYREARGVYWDESQKAFKSASIKEWTVSEWFFHIKNIVRSGLNVALSIDENAEWENISDEEISKITNAL